MALIYQIIVLKQESNPLTSPLAKVNLVLSPIFIVLKFQFTILNISTLPSHHGAPFIYPFSPITKFQCCQGAFNASNKVLCTYILYSFENSQNISVEHIS